DLGDGDVYPFFIDLVGGADDAASADVDHVEGVGEEAHGFADLVGGRDDHDVVQVPGPLPGVVQDIDVALGHLLERDLVQDVADAPRHGVHVARRARDRLGEHAAVAVVDAG